MVAEADQRQKRKEQLGSVHMRTERLHQGAERQGTPSSPASLAPGSYLQVNQQVFEAGERIFHLAAKEKLLLS